MFDFLNGLAASFLLVLFVDSQEPVPLSFIDALHEALVSVPHVLLCDCRSSVLVERGLGKQTTHLL